MSDIALELPARRFSVAEYRRIAQTGIFADERVELLDGTIVPMSPIGQRHWLLHARITAYLLRTIGDEACVVPQGSFPLGPSNEPEPDLAVLAPRWSRVPLDAAADVPPDEIFAVVEIAESSLARDLGFKARIYARFAVADYLVVDVGARELVHLREPHDLGYVDSRRLRPGETFELTRLPGCRLDVAEFVGGAPAP